MLKVLAKKFNFVCEVIYANQSFGAIYNGVWIGSVGYLYNKVKIYSKNFFFNLKIIYSNFLPSKSADIAICDLTKTLKRMTAADFTKSYLTNPLTFVTLRPEFKSRNWITIAPFSICIWVMIGLSFIITDISIHRLYIFENLDCNHSRIDSISISLIRALLQQCKKNNFYRRNF